MGNNLKELRLAFLLTPAELATRIGADVEQIEKLERAHGEIGDEWVSAVARALGVPEFAVVDPAADIRNIVARAGRAPVREVAICHIGARYAILAMVAKLGGQKMAKGLDDDAVAGAVQNVIAYVEAERGSADQEAQANRLSLALQITVLTILQSRGFVPGPEFPKAMESALRGATALLHAFSERLVPHQQ